MSLKYSIVFNDLKQSSRIAWWKVTIFVGFLKKRKNKILNQKRTCGWNDGVMSAIIISEQRATIHSSTETRGLHLHDVVKVCEFCSFIHGWRGKIVSRVRERWSNAMEEKIYVRKLVEKPKQKSSRVKSQKFYFSPFPANFSVTAVLIAPESDERKYLQEKPMKISAKL